MTAELPIPVDAKRSPDSTEIFRAWIVKGGLQVSLQRGFDDPAAWGILLADVARHASRSYAAEKVCTEADAMAAIWKMLRAEMERPTDLGTTGQVS